MIPIRRDGLVLLTDDDGMLVPQAHPSKIQDKWRRPLQSMVQAYQRVLGSNLSAVYARGSVAVGQALDGISDIDTFALLPCWAQAPDLAEFEPMETALSIEFPFVEQFEFNVFPYAALPQARALAALIATQSACVFGADITNRLARFAPGYDLLEYDWQLPLQAKTTVRRLANADSITFARWTRWLMKQFLRAGFGLVMVRADCFTRDPYPCYQYFADYYPEYATEMRRALELAINPGFDVAPIHALADKLAPWLHERLCAAFGAERMAQLLAAQHSTMRKQPL